jgi:hypothetical protein
MLNQKQDEPADETVVRMKKANPGHAHQQAKAGRPPTVMKHSMRGSWSSRCSDSIDSRGAMPDAAVYVDGIVAVGAEVVETRPCQSHRKKKRQALWRSLEPFSTKKRQAVKI